MFEKSSQIYISTLLILYFHFNENGRLNMNSGLISIDSYFSNIIWIPISFEILLTLWITFWIVAILHFLTKKEQVNIFLFYV